jgi:5-methylthioadenosine/S-adenosylhomocysteine deaminase
MTDIDFLIHARHIAPVEPPVVLEDHALAIRSGRIEAVLPREIAQARYAARENVTLARHLLIPGLIDAHARLGERLIRHLPDATRSARPALIRAGTALALAERTAAGITATLDASETPAAAAAAATAQGVRVVLALSMDPASGRGVDEQFQRSLATHDEFRDHPLLRTAFHLREPLALDAATLRRLRVLTDQLERPVVLSVQASREELQLCREWYGLTPIDWLSSLGLWNANTVALDLSVSAAAAIAAAAEAGVTVIHRIWRDLAGPPPLAPGSGLTPVAALAAAGVPVALGSGEGGSDLLVLARTARRVAGPDGSASDWLRRITLDGARALGLEAITGSLAPGKWADLCAVDLGGLATARDPRDILFESAARDCVTDVWVAGRRLIANRERLNVDPDGLAEDATAAIRSSLAASGSAARESRS